MKKSWKEFFLKYFDLNENNKIDWWEWLLPITIILTFEIIAEIIANYIILFF